MPIVLLDVDDVLAGFTKALFDHLRLKHGVDRHATEDHSGWDFFPLFSQKEKRELFDLVESEGFCEQLEILPGAQAGVEELRRRGAEIYFVTSPWVSSRYWQYERHHWLRRHFKAPRDHIFQTSAKHLVQGDFLVDDKVETVAQWAMHHSPRGGKGVIWDTPHNRLEQETFDRPYIRRTDDWDCLINRIIFG